MVIKKGFCDIIIQSLVIWFEWFDFRKIFVYIQTKLKGFSIFEIECFYALLARKREWYIGKYNWKRVFWVNFLYFIFIFLLNIKRIVFIKYEGLCERLFIIIFSRWFGVISLMLMLLPVFDKMWVFWYSCGAQKRSTLFEITFLLHKFCSKKLNILLYLVL